VTITRRKALQWLASGSAASLLPVPFPASADAIGADAPYKPEWNSLQQHKCPEWFRDAKFGIYFHWGLYSVPAFGNEWYPHWMYLPGRPEYDHHLATTGH
jgi:alpha-L-fucosidase